MSRTDGGFVVAKRSGREKAARLDRLDWLEAARVALHERGLEGVKVERLARDLGVSKGSFYWHFANRGELLEGLLSMWEESTDQLIEAVGEADDGPTRLSRLFALIGELGVTGEAAITTWAKQDPKVLMRARQVEAKRLAFLRDLFASHGFDEAEAERRAQVGYLAFQGYVHRLEPGSEGVSDGSGDFDALGQALVDILFAEGDKR